MRPDALARQIEADKRAGLTPFFVCATVGTTSSNAMDPVTAIGEVCRQNNLWLHVDAAMSGTAMLCPEFRHLQTGVELADSYNFNPHKWMFTNFDCNCFWVADRKALIQTLSILPEYLRNQATESGAVIDYRDWHIQLGQAVSFAEIVVRDSPLRDRGSAAPHPRARATGPAVRRLGASR